MKKEATDIVWTNEDCSTLWLSANDVSSFEEAYITFCEFWHECGVSLDEWVLPDKLEMVTGTFANTGEDYEVFTANDKGEEWYRISSD